MVRERIGSDSISDMLAWLLWRGEDCIGYIGTTLPKSDPFSSAGLFQSQKDLDSKKAATIWRSHVVDGSGFGTGAHVLARRPSRGLGIMTKAYVEVIRQLSEHGWALGSIPKARSPDAKALWGRLAATRYLEVVRRRASGQLREYAFILADNLNKVLAKDRAGS